MAYKTFTKNTPRIRGLGDLVAKVADPIAGAIDRASGGRTRVRGCAACAKRKEMLNHLLPFGG
jgi:hypothetical protein